MTHKEAYNKSQDTEFQVRLGAALSKYLQTVYGELDTAPSHTNRLKLAKKVLVDPLGEARKISLAAVVTLGDTPDSDAALDGLVGQWWTAVANADVLP